MLQIPQIAALTHGWWGLATAYATVSAPMLVGMLRNRAPWRKIALLPVMAAPAMGVASAGIALLSPLTHSLGIATGSLLQLTFATGIAAGIGYAGGVRLAGGVSPGHFHQRGAIIAESQADARRRPAGARSAGLTLAGIQLAAQDETKHFKFIGTTGTGKSTAILEILGAAIKRGDRAVIADPDAGYLARFYEASRGDVILNPFDKRSVKWDIFGEITSSYDVEQLARALIPDDGGSDRAWRGYARTFFAAVTRQAHAAGIDDVGELYRLMVVASTTELRALVAGTPAQPFLDEHNGRMFDSIRSVTSSAVSALEYIAAQRPESRRFSVRGWVRQGLTASGAPTSRGGILFVPYQAGQIATLRSPISAWMRLAIFEAMNQGEGDQRLWFVVDELDALGQIDGLKDALARLRKFGGRCVLGFQSIAQVSSTYGEGDAHTIVENCGNTLILRCSSSEGGGTSRFASRLIGEREVLRTTESTSRRPTDWLASTTRSEHFNTEVALLPSEIEQLPDLCGFLKIASRPEWLRVTLSRGQRHAPAAGVASLGAAAKRGWKEWRAQQRGTPDNSSHQEYSQTPGHASHTRRGGSRCD